MATATGTGTIPQYGTHSGIWSWITTVDHKRIGTMYTVTAFIFFLIGGFEALLIRTQLAVPNGTVVDADRFNQLFSMHAITMIFLAVMPMGVGFFNWLTPLMIGARDVAFPRLNALSYWIFLSGGLLLTFSFVVNEVPAGGWFAYAPLSGSEFQPNRGMDFYVSGLLVLGVSSVAGALNFAIDHHQHARPGTDDDASPRVHLDDADHLVPALPRTSAADGGADPVALRPQLRDELLHRRGWRRPDPVAAPLLGVRSPRGVHPDPAGHGHHLRGDSHFSRKPLFGYAAIVFAGIAIAFLGWAVWSHHMFTTGLGAIPQTVFAGTRC